MHSSVSEIHVLVFCNNVANVHNKGGQRFAHKNIKMQFFENKYAVWLYKSYHIEKGFLKL